MAFEAIARREPAQEPNVGLGLEDRDRLAVGRRRILDLVAQAVRREDLLRDLVVLLVGPGQLLLGQVHLGAHVHAGELEIGSPTAPIISSTWVM